jgi:hypothetical protein
MTTFMDPRTSTVLSWFSPAYKRMSLEHALIKEIFVYDAYAWLTKDLRHNTILLDFGASVGDTAIYFSKIKEITKVICCETDKEKCTWAEDNISKAPEKTKIVFINEPASLPKPNGSNTIIKCDIEGAEHELFTHRADLSDVYKIMLEYHNGIGIIKDVLEDKGFKVKVEKEHIPEAAKNLLPMGFIYAER